MPMAPPFIVGHVPFFLHERGGQMEIAGMFAFFLLLHAVFPQGKHLVGVLQHKTSI
jgi:hypothetical protein